MLSPYRALDLTDEKGLLCGKILADLGADVIQVEKPEGNPARSIPPYYEDVPDPERSLYWLAFSAGKRSITLNWESETGKDLFKRLTKKADFIIESFSPGYLERAGLGYEVLAKTNPHLLGASITPFGQTGPFKDYKAGDLVASAMGGMACCTGEPDRAPLRISRNTFDINAIPLLKSLTHLPVVADPSHGTGKWDLVAPVARAAVAAGADGLIVEVHPNPAKALSDGAQSLKPEKFAQLVIQVRQIAEAIGRYV